MKQVIKSVQPEPNFWEKGEKKAYFVNGLFADGAKFSVWDSSEAQAKETIDVFLKLIGKEEEYEIDGEKLKSWPGKPAPKGFGGKAPYVPKWADTEPGARWMDGRINRRRALELAVQFAQGLGKGSNDATDLAERFYTFLNADVPSGGVRADPQSPPSPGGALREESEPKQLKGKLPAASAPRAPAATVSKGENPWEGMDVT